MTNTNNIKFTKSEYTLRDFALFKLCPMMYTCSILYPTQKPINGEQRRLMLEAGILSDGFSRFANTVSACKKTYFKNTSLCLVDMVTSISDCLRERLSCSDEFDAHDVNIITNGLYDKAELIVADIHRWIKGSRYTILGGIQKQYQMDKFAFKYYCSYRSADCDKDGWRSIYINEYKDFPVFSAGDHHRRLIHYKDILKALDGDDPLTDRVGLALKVMRKINIQIESIHYESDGLERIACLGREIDNYDFSNACRKPSGFCNYCKYFEKCRQIL